MRIWPSNIAVRNDSAFECLFIIAIIATRDGVSRVRMKPRYDGQQSSLELIEASRWRRADCSIIGAMKLFKIASRDAALMHIARRGFSPAKREILSPSWRTAGAGGIL